MFNLAKKEIEKIKDQMKLQCGEDSENSEDENQETDKK